MGFLVLCEVFFLFYFFHLAIGKFLSESPWPLVCMLTNKVSFAIYFLLVLLHYITILQVSSHSDILLFTARLSHWLRKENADMPSDDNGPTHALICCHGSLLPEHAQKTKRVSVPENLWLFLYETAMAKKADDTVTFPSDCQPCEICSQELSVESNLR